MALLTTQVIAGGPPGAKVPTYGAATAGGDTFSGGQDIFLHVKKGAGGSDVTVTAAAPGSPGEGITEVSAGVVVPVGSEKMWGPFPADLFGQTVSITYSDVTTLTIAVLKFVPA